MRALSSRNYRLFFLGQGISVIGTWMQVLAVSWLVYDLTHSKALLGSLGFASQLPMLLLAPIAGALGDRWNTRRILIITQSVALLQALAMAVLSFTHVFAASNATAGVICLFILGTVLGIVNAFDMPTRQTFVVQMVERPEDLGNAIALNSSLVNAGRLVGPAIGGVLVASYGVGTCFLLNAISYLAVIVALSMMRMPPPAGASHHRTGRSMAEGFRYAWSFAPLRGALGLLALVSLLGMSYGTLMPVFATDILQGSARTQGFLMASTGIGALGGALFLASRPSPIGIGRVISGGALCFGIGITSFSQSRSFWLSMALLTVAGLGMMLVIAGCNTFIQSIVDDEKRGRVMGIYAMAFVGTTPLGSLIAGWTASFVGAPLAVLLGGSACAVAGVVFYTRLAAWRPEVRAVWGRKGLIDVDPNAV
jgi:MFS family permease